MDDLKPAFDGFLAHVISSELQKELGQNLAEFPVVLNYESTSEIRLATSDGRHFLITVEELIKCACGDINWEFAPEQSNWRCQTCGVWQED